MTKFYELSSDCLLDQMILGHVNPSEVILLPGV